LPPRLAEPSRPYSVRLEVETRSLTNTISNLEFSNQSLSTQLTKSSEEREQMEQLLFAEREKVDDLENTLSQLKSENHRLLSSPFAPHLRRDP
jgi:chromosome segregation ATPase